MIDGIIFVVSALLIILAIYIFAKKCTHDWDVSSIAISKPVGADILGYINAVLNADNFQKLTQGEITTTYICVNCGKIKTVSVIGSEIVDCDDPKQDINYVQPTYPTWTCTTTKEEPQ